MEAFKSILVDVDATASAHPALERAVRLARSLGATVTITDVVTVPPHARHYLPATLEDDMVRQRREQLARLASEVSGVRTAAKLLRGRPATVLIQEVLRAQHDLVMRSHARELVASSASPFGAVDMELLRNCPCPVLLVRHGTPAPRLRIVAAVDASTEEVEEQALNAKIVEVALLVASHLEAASPLVLQAWAPFAERMIRRYSDDDQFAYFVERARERAAADLARFIRSFGGRMTEEQAALRRGQPGDAIPEFVVAEGIDLVVMGTVARSGVAGMLIGNTAERVLRKLPCSVLTLKPDGFVGLVAGT